MKDGNAYTFWFVTGCQLLYTPQTLEQVAQNSAALVRGLNESPHIPFTVLHKGVIENSAQIQEVVRQANFDKSCAGIITFMHTFSPSKMWINGLSLLQKPYLHFHTQFHADIPAETIDMDYMNLHQSAHGDREHGFIGARLRLARKVVAGHWQDTAVQKRVCRWMQAAVGAAVSRSLKIMRFGDNMRDVAVTEGDKVEAQLKLGWQVNTWPVGLLAEYVHSVSEQQIAAIMEEYRQKYTLATKDTGSVLYQAKLEAALRKMLVEEGCHAFTDTFEDLHGLRQLPGLSAQSLMAKGYGYAAEGDWKTAAMVAIIKSMALGVHGGTSFMEDYCYDFPSGLILGAHMLEVCPTLAAAKPHIEVHPLHIGGREAPARLVFEGKPGPAVTASLVDMGGRMRLIVQDIECVSPIAPMPKLPVAHIMWRPAPSLESGAEAWILAGGAHHTALSFDVDAEILQNWARIMDIEFVHIHSGTTPEKLEQELLLADTLWKLK